MRGDAARCRRRPSSAREIKAGGDAGGDAGGGSSSMCARTSTSVCERVRAHLCVCERACLRVHVRVRVPARVRTLMCARPACELACMRAVMPSLSSSIPSVPTLRKHSSTVTSTSGALEVPLLVVPPLPARAARIAATPPWASHEPSSTFHVFGLRLRSSGGMHVSLPLSASRSPPLPPLLDGGTERRRPVER
eukprot:3805815-Pleurochrysis_carterae.AAC.1